MLTKAYGAMAIVSVVFVLGCKPKEPKPASYAPAKLGDTVVYLNTQMHAHKPVPVDWVLKQIGAPDYRTVPDSPHKTIGCIYKEMVPLVKKTGKLEVWLWHPAIRARRIDWVTWQGKTRHPWFGPVNIEVAPSLGIVVYDGQVVHERSAYRLPTACAELGISYAKLKSLITEGKLSSAAQAPAARGK